MPRSKFHALALSLVLALPLMTALAARAAPVPEPALAEAQLRAINHRYVDAFANDASAYMAALTDEDFLLTSLSGEWLDRDAHLEVMRRHDPTLGVSYDDVRVRLFREIALVHGTFEMAPAGGGAPRRVRYTDVYRWNGEAWKLVSAQNTAYRAGVGKAMHAGVAPTHAAWKGTDPTGDDLDVLRQLNESYVRAFRESDVAWYDAHLADNYVVINGDGSLHDRAAALANFAKPNFATHFERFPVDRVNIRLFGEIALIHAENAYVRKDGRTGASRYTDIWRKVDGRWECVAAHLTDVAR